MSFFYLFLCFSLQAVSCTQESLTHEALKAYVENGEYFRDVQKAVDDFSHRLEKLPALHHALYKKAVIVDVDETLLTNVHYFAQVDYRPSTKSFYDYLAHPQTTANEAVVRLVMRLQAQGYGIFIVTGRPQRFCAITASQLTKIGLSEYYEQLFCNASDLDPVQYKQNVLSTLKGRGYDIVIHINDQCSELALGSIPMLVKLPNPFYNVQS